MADVQSGTPSEPPKKGCIGRNWKMLLGCGCLTGVLLCGGGIGFSVYGFSWFMKSFDVYKEAVAKAKSDPVVIEALGEPIEEGFVPTGKINTMNDTGDGDFKVSLTGPKGKGSLNVTATKATGEPWQYSTFSLETNNGVVNLRKPR